MQTISLDWLPGTIHIDKGTIGDYRALSHFHYAPGDPATFAGIWKAVYQDDRHDEAPIAGLVASIGPSALAGATPSLAGAPSDWMVWLFALLALGFIGEVASRRLRGAS